VAARALTTGEAQCITIPALKLMRHRKAGTMHAVVRNYSGAGAKELFARLAERSTEIETLIRGVQGFVSYTLLQTDDGGLTVTVCQDKAGTDESVQVAREWVQANASDLSVNPPQVSDGPAPLHFTA
jgi:hypothetical protein